MSQARCLECGHHVAGEHAPGCKRYLEIAADEILMADRKEHCGTTMKCKTKFYLDRQYEIRTKKEKRSGLHPQGSGAPEKG
jgi:hypothetical protein